jgi:hypothetical protein
MPCPACDSRNTEIPFEDQVDVAEVGRAALRTAKGLAARAAGAQFGALGYSAGDQIAKEQSRDAQPLVKKDHRMWYRCNDCKKQWGIALQPFRMSAEDIRKCKRKHFRTGILPALIFVVVAAAIFIAGFIANRAEENRHDRPKPGSPTGELRAPPLEPASTATARSGTAAKPLANARGSVGSHDREYPRC